MIAVHVAAGVVIGALAVVAIGCWAYRRVFGDPADNAWISGYKARIDRLVDKMEREVDQSAERDEPWRR
jgi:hypothetical protein